MPTKTLHFDEAGFTGYKPWCAVLRCSAGLAARQFSPASLGDDREFMERLVGNGFSELVYNGIRPDIVFPDQIPHVGFKDPTQWIAS
jgi:hypothetical protein